MNNNDINKTENTKDHLTIYTVINILSIIIIVLIFISFIQYFCKNNALIETALMPPPGSFSNIVYKDEAISTDILGFLRIMKYASSLSKANVATINNAISSALQQYPLANSYVDINPYSYLSDINKIL